MKFLLFLFYFLSYIRISYCLEDNFYKAIEIAAHGCRFQSERIKIASENLANADSTAKTFKEDPYKRKTIYGTNQYDRKAKTHLLKVSSVRHDKSPFIIKYDPYHPAANNYGYVKYPNVQIEIEKIDAHEAARSHEANLTIIEITNSLISKTIELLK